MNMGVLNGIGALLGQGFGANQQQQLQAYQDAWAVTGTANGSAANTYALSIAPITWPEPAAAPHKETALEWLDRRIAEVRLPLAA